MKKFSKYLSALIFCAFILSLLVVQPALGAPVDLKTGIEGQLKGVGAAAGFKEDTTGTGLATTIGYIINVFLSILGVIFVVLIVYAGYLWMTSMGAEEKVKKAKELIIDAVIGLIILLSAYAITGFVVKSLVGATTGT